MPPKLHEAAAAPESSHSCCVGKYGNTTVQVMHNARHRPLLTACARRPPVSFSARLFPSGARPLRADCQAPRVRLGRRVFMVRVQHRHGPSSPCRPDQHRDAPPKNRGLNRWNEAVKTANSAALAATPTASATKQIAPRMPSAGPMKSSLPIWTACRKPPPP